MAAFWLFGIKPENGLKVRGGSRGHPRPSMPCRP